MKKTYICIFYICNMMCGEIYSAGCNFQYPCHTNSNIIKHAELSEFIKQVVNQLFSDCYGIQIYPENPEDISSNWDIPSMQVKSSHNTTGHGRDYNSLVKFGKQCLVYEVHLNGQDHNNNGILEIFASSESQIRAKDSYIIVNEFRHLEAAKKFLIEPRLKNYPNRVWLDLVSLEPHENLSHDNTGLIFYHFCFYCDNGNPSIVTINRVYRHASEITAIYDIFPDVTNNLHGHTLRVTAPPAPPLVLITPSKSNSDINEIQGQQKNVLDGIAGKYNFTCKLYPVPGGSTGSKLPNGTWNGVMGEILYGRADIGLTVATAYDRREIADFTVSVFYAFLVLVSTKPIPVFEWQSIFYPFKTSTWFALVGTTLLTLCLFQFLHNRSLILEVPARRNWKSKLLLWQQIKTEIMTGFRAFYMTVGTLLEQSVSVDYNTMPSRIIGTFWMMFAIIITCAYRSKLFSFLISPTIETPPSSFQELAESDYTWGMKSLGGIALLFITHSPLAYIRNIGERMEIYTDKYSCLDKTFEPKFTCIIYKAYIDYMLAVRYWKLKNKFYSSDFVTPPVGSAWSLAKHSPLKRNFDEMSFRIYEMGLADKYLNDYQVAFAEISRAHAQASNETDDTFNLNTNFKNADDSGPQPLEMANLYGGFFILGLGICLSVSLLLLEIFQRHKSMVVQKRLWKIIRSSIKEFGRHHEISARIRFPQVVQLIIPSSNASGNVPRNQRNIQ